MMVFSKVQLVKLLMNECLKEFCAALIKKSTWYKMLLIIIKKKGVDVHDPTVRNVLTM